MAAGVQPTPSAPLDPDRDFDGLRAEARRRFLARARRAGQQAFHDLDEAADEAYQDAWLELVRRPAPAVVDPAGYLAGIMWHRFHRRELRPARAPAAPLDDRLASGDPAPEEVAADRAALHAVREALGDLPERERAAVLLRSLGLGLDDVAASLGVSARRARKLSDSGHRRLAAQLAAESAGERCAAAGSTLRALSLGWEIAGRRRTRLEHHLTACSGCRATVAALRREGRLAVMPVALAGGSEAGARGLVEHAAQTVARVGPRARGRGVHGRPRRHGGRRRAGHEARRGMRRGGDHGRLRGGGRPRRAATLAGEGAIGGDAGTAGDRGRATPLRPAARPETRGTGHHVDARGAAAEGRHSPPRRRALAAARARGQAGGRATRSSRPGGRCSGRSRRRRRPSRRCSGPSRRSSRPSRRSSSEAQAKPQATTGRPGRGPGRAGGEPGPEQAGRRGRGRPSQRPSARRRPSERPAVLGGRSRGEMDTPG